MGPSPEIRRLEEKIEALDRLFTERFTLRDEAIEIAREDVERRLDGMNEVREQISSERGRYLTREMYDERHQVLTDLVGSLENRVSAIEGGSLIKAATIGWLLAGMGLLITIVVVVVNVVTAH